MWQLSCVNLLWQERANYEYVTPNHRGFYDRMMAIFCLRKMHIFHSWCILQKTIVHTMVYNLSCIQNVIILYSVFLVWVKKSIRDENHIFFQRNKTKATHFQLLCNSCSPIPHLCVCKLGKIVNQKKKNSVQLQTCLNILTKINLNEARHKVIDASDHKNMFAARTQEHKKVPKGNSKRPTDLH